MTRWQRIVIALGSLLVASNSLYAPRVRLHDGSPLSRASLLSPTFDKYGYERTGSNTSSYQSAGVDFPLWAVWSSAIIAMTVAAAALASKSTTSRDDGAGRTSIKL
jgi:hypothetical protein